LRANPAARGYDAAWRKVRTAKLRRNPVCEDCARRGVLTAASVVDHIETIRARPDLRLSMGNLQSLCVNCHSSAKQYEDKRGYSPGFDVNGNPLDPRHPSNA
jgi:5-methylcytosine-specific restriction endonuclease McrA